MQDRPQAPRKGPSSYQDPEVHSPEMPGRGYPQPGKNRPEMDEGATQRSIRRQGPELDDRARQPGVNAPETSGDTNPQPGVTVPETAGDVDPQPGVTVPETAGTVDPQPGVTVPETAGTVDPQPGVTVPETAAGGMNDVYGVHAAASGMPSPSEQIKATAFPQRDVSMSDVQNHEYPEMPDDDHIMDAHVSPRR